MSSDIKRKVSIELQLLASGNSKAQAERVKAGLGTISMAADKASGSLLALGDAGEKTTSRLEASFSQAAKSVSMTSTAARERLKVEKAAASEIEKVVIDSFNGRSKAQQRSIDQLDRQRSRALEKEHRDLERQQKAGERAVAQLDRQRERSIKQQVQEQDQASKKMATMLDSVSAKQAVAGKAAEVAMQKMLTSSVQMAQGFAQLGLVGEQDLQLLLQGLVKVQGATNALKGTLEVFFAMRDAANAARSAILATAGASQLLAASGKTSVAGGVAAGVASGAASGAMGGAAGRAAGQMGAGLTGSAVAGGLAAKMPTLFGLGKMAIGGAATAGTSALALAGGAAGGEALSRIATGGRTGTITETIGLVNDWRKNSATNKKISKAEQARLDRLQLASERDARITSDAQQATAARDRKRSVATQLDSIEEVKPEVAANRERLRALQELDQAKAAADEAERNRIQRQNQLQVASEAERIAAQDRLLSATERLAAVERQNLDVLKSQKAELQASVEQRREQLNAAQSTLEAEQGRTKDKLAQFGRLSKGEQARLTEISKRMADGETLTRADIDTLERSGFGGEAVRDHYKQEGEAAGGMETLSRLGERDAEDDAHAEVQRQSGNLNQAEVMRDSMAAAVAQQKEITDRQIRAMDRLAEAIERSNQNGGGGAVVGSGETIPTSGQDVASLGMEVQNSVARLARNLTQGIDQQAEQFRRHQTLVAAAQPASV